MPIITETTGTIEFEKDPVWQHVSAVQDHLCKKIEERYPGYTVAWLGTSIRTRLPKDTTIVPFDVIIGNKSTRHALRFKGILGHGGWVSEDTPKEVDWEMVE